MQSGILFGLGAALSWGMGDFFGGIGSRRIAPFVVTFAADVVGLVVLLVIALVVQPPAPQLGTVGIAIVAGLAGGLGLAFLYQAFSLGSMGLVSALAGGGAALIPLVVTILFGAGLEPLQIAGVVCVLVAALMATDISRDAAGRRALLLSFGAAAGFATWYLLLDQAAHDSGLWALVVSRSSSAVLIGAICLLTPARADLGRMSSVLGIVVVAGLCDVGANGLFIASRAIIPVAVAAALSGLYPLVTMFLARAFLAERLPRLGVISVGVAVAGTVLISIGS
jgi:drug/metabolite transporter (DMT)-like permease